MQRFTPLLADAARFGRHRPGDRWFVDETYVKVNRVWRYVYRAIDHHGQVIDVLLSARRDADAARRFFRRAIATLKVTPTEVITDAAPVYPAVLDELTRPMRGLRTERAAQTVIAGHAFIQNLRRGHYERGLDVPPALWVPRRSPNSPARSDPGHTPRSNASPDRQMQQRHGQDQQRTVHTGRRGDQYTEIRSGPSEGDSVVTGGR